jgi:cytochrome c
MPAAGALALVLAACGGSDTSTTPTAPPPAQTAETPPAAEEPATETAEAPEPAETETVVAEAPAAPAETAAPAAGAATGFAAFTGDAARGRRVFAQCQTCHAVQPGRNNVGPSLHGIIGRTAGSVEGFRYSAANQNSNVVWTEENMFEYLENPARYIPGTIMAFPGLRNPQDRADVIAYLAEQS